MKIAILCGVLDGGKPHTKEVGAIKRDDLDFARGVVTFDRLREEERHYVCPKHGAMQIHDEDLLRLALNPSRPPDRGPERAEDGRALTTRHSVHRLTAN